MNELSKIPSSPEPSLFPPVLDEIKIVCISDIDNNIYGPLSKLEILQCISSGRIDKDTKVNFRVGKDNRGNDVYYGWQRFERSKWKNLLSSSILEVIPHNYPRQITNVNVNTHINNPTSIKQLPLVMYDYRISAHDKFYFVDDGDTTHGPFYGSALNKLLNDGLINRTNLVYVEGGVFRWRPLHEI